MKEEILVATALLLACALYGCADSQSHSEPDSARSASAPSDSTSLQEDANRGVAASQTPMPPEENAGQTSSSGSTASVVPASLDEAALTAYVEDLGHFFQSPVASSQELPTDYSLSFFLLYETFTRNGGEKQYTQNENFFWEIPETDLLQTATDCLGLSDLTLSALTEWPFGDPQDGFCYYSQESSLPYSDLTVTDVSYEETTGEAAVSAQLRDSQFEDSTHAQTTLVYHLLCTQRSDGTVLYCLQSISTP